MFNNSGHCAHIRPIIGCKGNGYKTDSQMIGLNEATMYGFALYALTGRFMLHRFAIVFRIPVTRFKSLNSPDWAWVKGFQKGTHEKAYLGGYLKWKNARGYHTDAKCCHAFVKRWNYERNDFSLHHGRLEQPLRVRRTTPLPTTYCHKLPPPHCKSIVTSGQRIYFAGETDY